MNKNVKKNRSSLDENNKRNCSISSIMGWSESKYGGNTAAFASKYVSRNVSKLENHDLKKLQK